MPQIARVAAFSAFSDIYKIHRLLHRSGLKISAKKSSKIFIEYVKNEISDFGAVNLVIFLENVDDILLQFHELFFRK